MGLISNIDQDIKPVCSELGLDTYITQVVTSKDVRSEKPHPLIFLAALDGAGVEAEESVYVGDQYSCDVVGARGVGMKPILVDRYDLFPEITDCVRIQVPGGTGESPLRQAWACLQPPLIPHSWGRVETQRGFAPLHAL